MNLIIGCSVHRVLTVWPKFLLLNPEVIWSTEPFQNCFRLFFFLFTFMIAGNVFVFFFQRTKDLDTPELLEQIPALQQLLFRVLGCQVILNLSCFGKNIALQICGTIPSCLYHNSEHSILQYSLYSFFSHKELRSIILWFSLHFQW